MKLSSILLYSGVAIIGVTSVLSWQRSNATAAAQRRAAVMATDQRGAVVPLAVPNAIAAAPTSSQVAAPTPTTPASPAAPSPAPQTESPYFKPIPSPSPTPGHPGRVITIRSCNGQTGNANLRSEPSLAHEAILGVVPQGQAVKLTGRAAIRDGEFWYEAITIAPLAASSNSLAANTGVGQRNKAGWISGCFVNGEGR